MVSTALTNLTDDPTRPWDARLARWLVSPLRATPVTPNHLTTLRLAVGMAAVATIFGVRANLEGRIGKAGARLPALSGFEIEDCLYLMPVVTFTHALPLFLYGSVVGAPLFALWVTWSYRAAAPTPSEEVP